MLDHLASRYERWIDRFVVVAAPSAADEIRRRLVTASRPADVVIQEHPDGMLPAILCASRTVAEHRPDQVWITWCDQVGISAGTVAALARELDSNREVALVMPTVRQSPPYIHFSRDASGRIHHVLQRREGHAMPDSGESDAGLFGLTLRTFQDDLAAFTRDAAPGDGTGETNFLPFIPWLAARKPVRTFDVPDAREALGVNTADDLAQMQQFLREREHV
jgi:bifunctional N-acetylglucosamine-1-phosphate-uridyltransferase/glucosamine-1-phosphate-acetyltransferase GlmU-like protein